MNWKPINRGKKEEVCIGGRTAVFCTDIIQCCSLDLIKASVVFCRSGLLMKGFIMWTTGKQEQSFDLQFQPLPTWWWWLWVITQTCPSLFTVHGSVSTSVLHWVLTQVTWLESPPHLTWLDFDLSINDFTISASANVAWLRCDFDWHLEVSPDSGLERTSALMWWDLSF